VDDFDRFHGDVFLYRLLRTARGHENEVICTCGTESTDGQEKARA